MVTSTCPDRNDLRSFHLGMLDERRELEVLDHLNDCPTCEDTVANLEGTADSLIAAVRSSGGASGNSASAQSEDRPALQQALAEIECFVDAPSPGSPVSKNEASPVSERIRDYELLGTLGEGGMGTVYRARHTRLDRQVALKLLPARRLRDNAAVARFEREMKAIGRLDHPTIVRATDAGDVDGTHFLAMDYVEGIDLSKLVRLVGPLDVASACEIVRQAAIGLDYAHQQELIHRDVKPSNLMLTLNGEVRILDLGLALFGAASEALDELTTVGQLMGTLDYMAPEQGDNSHDVDARADVYSLGATLFKLLTATAPYDSPGTRTPLAKMKALATIDAPSVAERRSELPADLVAVVDRALLRNVDDRFASAKELADALLPFCEGHVLSDLAECGRDLAMHEDEKIPQPPTLPPFVQKAEIAASPANVTRADDRGNRHPGVGRRIATWILVPLILLAGIVIWIQTDNGTLVVESLEGSIPIEIRTGGKFHRSETLSVGKNELTIHSGTYEIVLPKEYDSLKVENNVFTLKRGGEWVARITRTKSPQSTGSSGTPDLARALNTDSARPTTIPGMSPGRSVPGISTTNGTAGALVFSGKSFEEWQHAVLTERNPAELKDAVQALCILGRNNRDEDAAAAVLQVVDAYECVPRDFAGEGSLVAEAIRQLRTLNPAKVIPAIAASVRTRGTNTRTLVLEFLAGGKESSRYSGLPDMGSGLPLSQRLKASSEFNETLVDIFDELSPANRLSAFEIILDWFAPNQPGQRQIEFFEKCSRHSPADGIAIRAARRLAEIRPTADLADIFLDHLETINKPMADVASKEGGRVDNWWPVEADAWLGLAALGKHAAGSVDRIARLVDNVPAELAKPQSVLLMISQHGARARFEVHRQLLPLEILGLVGPPAASALPAVNKVLATLTGASPESDGDFGFDGFHNRFVLEQLLEHDGWTETSSAGGAAVDGVSVPERQQRLNSALVAIRRITGQAARFDVSQIDANEPKRRTGDIGSGYVGGGSASMMSAYDGEGEYGGKAPEQHTPRLVTYKGKTFAEWTDPRNVANSVKSLGDLRDVFRGASLLAKTPPERTSAAEIAISAYEYAIRQPWELTQELRAFLVDTVEASHSLNPDVLMTPIEDTLAQVTPARQSFLLAELLVPVEESVFGSRLHERPFSREVVVNPQFPNAYNDLVENWDKHPAELQEAILQVEAHLPALGRKNSVRLLTRLLEESQDTIGDGAIPVAMPTDLQMKAAFILAATSPKDPTIQGQLEKLLAGVLARPHVLRSRVDDETGKAPQLEENAAAPTMRDLDADQLHAAVALKLACGGSLSEATARQFATLIVQDTERHEIGTFRIVSPPDGSDIPGLSSGLGQFDESGDGELSTYATGGGYPGMGGGYPVAADPGGGEHRPETIVKFQGTAFSSDHGEFSRRVLMAHLLLTVPPDDLAVKHEIGELFANWLMENYSGTVLPAPGTSMTDPQTMSGNVSLYSLIESEFRSGVRYRKRPSNKEASKEITLETLRFIDAVSRIVPNYISEGLLRHIQQKHLAARAATESGRPFGANTTEITYDGRPFEEWRSVVATERSPERLVEAVQALAILGKYGRDAEAATAILGCLAPFSPDSRLAKTPEGRLIDTIQERLWQLDRQKLVPVIVDQILHGNSNQRQFLVTLNAARLESMLVSDGPLMTPQFVSVLLEATNDSEPKVRESATKLLTPLLLTGAVSLPADKLASAKTRLVQLLADERANLAAAVCLSQLAPETEGLSKILLSGIDEFMANETSRSLQLIDPYWALRKLIVQDQSDQEKLTPQLIELLKKQRNKPSAHVFAIDYYDFDHECLIAEVVVAGKRRSNAVSKQIQGSLVDVYSTASRITGRNLGGGGALDDKVSPNLAPYKPVLTDEYRFPIPAEFRRQRAPNDRQSDADITAAAVVWALNQPGVAGDSKQADK